MHTDIRPEQEQPTAGTNPGTNPGAGPDWSVDPETQRALDCARALARGGIPVFVARPCPPGCPVDGHRGEVGDYHPPRGWPQCVADPAVVDAWRPGDALAAVGGVTADFLDVDPRNGGDESESALRTAGHMPRVFGIQESPSGGRHYLISRTGERKGVLPGLPGIDLQSGAEDGRGKGFVWIAPTLRISKGPVAPGELRTYRWTQEPDVDLLREYAGADDSVRGIVDRASSRTSTGSVAHTGARDPHDPFLTADDIAHGAGRTRTRDFTRAQAEEFCRPDLYDLRAAQIGSIEETTNRVAVKLSHFVPEFWSVDEAFRLLADALKHTAYDPERPGASWRAEKFLPVLDGRRPPADSWKARRVPDPPPSPPPVTGPTGGGEGDREGGDGEEPLSVLERLRQHLVSAEELASSEPPKPLIHGLLDLDSESWLIGAPGSGKSFVALDIAGHVGEGREWHGHRVVRHPVLYVAAEGARGMVLRTRAWMREHGGRMDGVTFLPYPVRVRSVDGQWGALAALAGELRPGLVVIDTQHRVSIGLEENSATDMGILTEAVSALRRATGACVLVIHHTGRNGGDARGSSALDGAQDTELKVIRGEPRESLRIRVVQDKQKDMGEGDGNGIELQMRIVDMGVDPETGRILSSLVIDSEAPDPYDGAQDDVGARERSERPWIPLFDKRDIWRTRILAVFYDLAPREGLTEAKVRDLLTRFHPNEFPQALRKGRFAVAWKGVLDTQDASGDPVVTALRPGRYDITSLPTLGLLEQEWGPRGGQG